MGQPPAGSPCSCSGTSCAGSGTSCASSGISCAGSSSSCRERSSSPTSFAWDQWGTLPPDTTPGWSHSRPVWREQGVCQSHSCLKTASGSRPGTNSIHCGRGLSPEGGGYTPEAAVDSSKYALQTESECTHRPVHMHTHTFTQHMPTPQTFT